MKNHFHLASLALVTTLGFVAPASAQSSAEPKAQPAHPVAAPNTLTEAESAAGWQLLWDGKTKDGWRSPKTQEFPTSGWTIKDGILSTVESSGHEAAGGGDIITRGRYSDFELSVDFRITPGANSGIKIFVQPGLDAIGKKDGTGSAIGLECQILDDKLHPDAKLGHNGDRTIGSLYDLMAAPADKKVMPVGEWNTARILSKGKHVEFWLNGVKTVEFERGSEDFRTRVAASKYQKIPNFGEWEDGHILLQEHGNAVSYRNVKIHNLAGK